MRLESILKTLKQSNLHTFYPNAFPSSKPCSVINISGGTVERGGVYQLSLRILTRETHPSLAINKAHEIKEYLYKNVKGAFFNGKKVLAIETVTPEPLDIGEEDGTYTVSFNYTIIEG